MKRTLLGLLPIVLLTILVIAVLSSGQSGLLGGGPNSGARPPIEELKVVRTRLGSNMIEFTVFNDGPDPVKISQVIVNGAYWSFDIEPDRPISRMQRATVEIEYPWNTGDDQHITFVTSTGVTVPLTIPAAMRSPALDPSFAGYLAFIGLLIGVVPVMLGLLWFPFVKGLPATWYTFFMALSVGLLVFLGVDSLEEALELVHDAPEALNGIGVLLIGFAVSFFVLFFLSRGRKTDTSSSSDDTYRRRVVAFSAALGIGVHNLGEGLAVGSAFAIGNIALGGLLVVGFMIHNVTEGLPIVAPIAHERARVGRLALLGLLAGAPAIVGTIIGGYAYSAIWSVFFLGIGAGAIFQVSIEVALYIGRKRLTDLVTAHSVAGFIVGLLVMYGTGLIISG